MARLSLARWIPGADTPPAWAPIQALAGLSPPDPESVLLLTAWLEPDPPNDEEARFVHFLHREDRVRLDRFRVDIARRRFLVGRGLVRAVLGHALDRPPLTVPLINGAHGKPALDPVQCPEPIHFNLSHSGSLVLIGFTRGRELGVDVELIRHPRLKDEIMARYFHPDERDVVSDDADFFRCWSLKEAAIKALGRGLAYPTASFSVAPLLRSDHEIVLSMEDRTWRCTGLSVRDDYAAALVIEVPP